MIYEFITPSDPITFLAPDDKVAFVTALMVGSGKACCNREDGAQVDCCFLFSSEQEITEAIQRTLGCDLKCYLDEHREAIASALESFAYGKVADRHVHDAAVRALKKAGDMECLQEFLAEHEDRLRSSMSEWVAYAWDLAKNMRDTNTKTEHHREDQ